MRLWLLGLLCLTASVQAGPRIAIIIDDVGNAPGVAQQVLALPKPVTVAILPGLNQSTQIAEQAHRQGREVMLHQPMQALNYRRLGPGGLTLHHSREQMHAVLRENLTSVPYATGINNHMGSLLTRNPESMRWLMQALQEQGLFFVDSRTDSGSHAERQAREHQLLTARRDVFLDNDPNPDAIRLQLEHTLALAKRRGSAIAIGHPYPGTLQVLREVLPQWQAQGVKLLRVSELIAYQRSPESWHASSSRLPKVAKNSKPSP